MNKKILIILLALVLILAFTTSAFAHPKLPVKTVSLPDAACKSLDTGIHKAYLNTQEDSIARHVMENKFELPMDHPSIGD